MCYAMANDGKEQTERRANYNISCGFHWTKELSKLLGQYENQREKYRTLDAFMPEIIGFFTKL
ncbi:MAG: DUF4932 domain-containing protein [Sedimentisphaerales bacterium]|nr:DUF4932 domain-containing protein [Sedimentisphaerales bacterium]